MRGARGTVRSWRVTEPSGDGWCAVPVWAVLLPVCGGCVAGPYGAGADDVLSEVLRNFGMVVVPLVFVAFAGCGMSGAAFRVTKDVADFNLRRSYPSST